MRLISRIAAVSEASELSFAHYALGVLIYGLEETPTDNDLRYNFSVPRLAGESLFDNALKVMDLMQTHVSTVGVSEHHLTDQDVLQMKEVVYSSFERLADIFLGRL